jgi:hypothetical protein
MEGVLGGGMRAIEHIAIRLHIPGLIHRTAAQARQDKHQSRDPLS